MSLPFTFPNCPRPPAWHFCWPGIMDAIESLSLLSSIDQDPNFHGEGDVLTHTRLVCERLTLLDSWRSLPDEERSIVFAACLLHDIGKKKSSRVDCYGHITSKGHSRIGACQARILLDSLAVQENLHLPFYVREQIVALIRQHSLPCNFIRAEAPERSLIRVSQVCRCDLLAMVAEADVRGRVCADQEQLLSAVDLFRETCSEHACFHGAYSFPSDHTRFLYFRSAERLPDFKVYDDTRFSVTIMSGLPGSGKSQWIANNNQGLPVVSLDEIRDLMEISPSQEQGRVIQYAKEAAREYLRKRHSFIWDATNVSRQLRQQVIGLFADYHAHIRIIFVDTPMSQLMRKNQNRPKPVPEKVVWKLVGKLELPDLSEAHEVLYLDGNQSLKAPLHGNSSA